MNYWRHIPASALICIREAAYQVSEAKKIEKYWGKLSNYLGVNLELPTQDTYLALRKSDPFLYTTEILYTWLYSYFYRSNSSLVAPLASEQNYPSNIVTVYSHDYHSIIRIAT